MFRLPFLSQDTLTFSQRWASYLTLGVILGMFVLGVNFRDRVLYRTTFYRDTVTGISASYPVNWLLDTNGDYVFRVRDMQYRGYKTTFQVSLISVGREVTSRNIADRLALSRAQTLTDYRVVSVEPFARNLAGVRDQPTQSVLYTFVERDRSPFLEGLSTVIIGLDIIQISGNQAIIITFRADRENYDQQYPLFERFLLSLAF
jgi:hypothetical protein